MKRGTGKLLVGFACGLLIAGGIGAIAYGSDGFTNSDLTTWFDGDWRNIKFDDQVKDWTGSRIDPDIVLPDGFTYKITNIEKDGESVDLEIGAIDEGDYIFTIEVSKGDKTKTYFCNLKITNSDDNLETNVVSSSLKLRTMSVNALADGSVEKVISYTVSGDTETYTDFYAQVSFIDGSENVDQYLTAEVNTSAKTLTLNCLQAFNKQIYVDLISTINPNVSARVTCDYKEKLLSGAQINISGYLGTQLDDTVSISISTVAPVYSIGTITADNKITAENFSVSYSYVQGGGSTWDSLFGSASSMRSSANNKWKISNIEYGSRDEALAAIKSNVTNYFKNLVTGKTNTAFSLAGLRNACSYQYATNYTYQWQYASDLYTITDTFIANFNTSGTKSSSLNWSISAYGSSKTISFAKISPNGEAANISLNSNSVVF